MEGGLGQHNGCVAGAREIRFLSRSQLVKRATQHDRDSMNMCILNSDRVLLVHLLDGTHRKILSLSQRLNFSRQGNFLFNARHIKCSVKITFCLAAVFNIATGNADSGQSHQDVVTQAIANSQAIDNSWTRVGAGSHYTQRSSNRAGVEPSHKEARKSTPVNNAFVSSDTQYLPHATTTVDGWQIVGSAPLPEVSKQHTIPHFSARHSSQRNALADIAIGVPSGGGASADGWFNTSRQQVRNNVSHESARVSAPDAAVDDKLSLSSNDISNTNTASTQAEPQGVSDQAEPQGVSDAAVIINVPQGKAVNPALSSKVISQNIDLFLGEVKVIGDVDVSRVAIGNGSIVRAEVLDSGELLIIATAAGSSSIRLWNNNNTQSDYNVRVSESDPQTRVRMQPIVRMRVRMVEFRKSALGRLGIDWGDSVSGPTLAATGSSVLGSFNSVAAGIDATSAVTAPFSTFFGIASNITSSINFLAQNGDAVTLAEPVLSAMNGSTASFLAGGEVPYPVVGDNGQTQIEFKEYGVKLNVAPLIDNAGNVHAIVETEISQLDTSVSINGTPGLLTRRAQTEVTVSSGETIVISGLLSSDSSSDVDLIPGLGNLPIIGRFFRSESRNNSASELVIFVTPEVIEPGNKVISSREQQYFNQSEQRLNMARQQLPLME